MLRKAWRTRASSPATSALVAGSMPRIPATKTKSPARAPSAHGPVGRIAPGGASVRTPGGEASAIFRACSVPSESEHALDFFVWRMFFVGEPASTSPEPALARWHAGLQRQRVQDAAHLGFQ